MHDGFIPNNEERRYGEERKVKTVVQGKAKKDLDEYISLYNGEKRLREDAERDLANLKKLYVRQTVPLTKSAVGYITNDISTTRTVMGWGALLSFFTFIMMIGAGANAEAHGVEPLSVMYPISALLSGIICLLIAVFMPDQETTYNLLNDYRNAQISSRLYDAGLLYEKYEDDD